MYILMKEKVAAMVLGFKALTRYKIVPHVAVLKYLQKSSI